MIDLAKCLEEYPFLKILKLNRMPLQEPEFTPVFAEFLIKCHKIEELDLSFSDVIVSQLVKYLKSFLEPEEPREQE